MLIDHLWSNEPGLTDELSTTLNELTSLNRSEHSRVALRARQVCITFKTQLCLDFRFASVLSFHSAKIPDSSLDDTNRIMKCPYFMYLVQRMQNTQIV